MRNSEHRLNSEHENGRMSRRQFIHTAVAGSAAVSGWLGQVQAADNPGPLKMGLIGAGWYGMVDVEAAFKVGGVEVVAVCDVDSQHLKDSADQIEQKQGKRPQTFKYYQDLLKVSELQAVIIATPPHWHALPFLAALDRGLDVYCEKPLAYDVREGQVMVAAAAQTDRIVQVGFQRRQSPAIRAARDYIRQGKLGRIVNVDVQIHYRADMRDATPQEPPASLDWDLWCGPAPKLPYSPQVGHFAWRLEKAYGNGHLVDWGIHMVDAARWILGETMPRTVQAAGGIYYFKDKITTPDILTAYFDFKTCPVVWKHRMWGATEYSPEISNGILFYGEEGTLFVSDNQWTLIPKQGERQVNRVRFDTGKEHMAGFIEAVRTRQQPLCTPQDGFYSTATVQLAMIAYELGEKVTWDLDTGDVVGHARAQGLLKRDYRAPWKHVHQKS